MNKTEKINNCADIPGCLRRISNGERLWLWSPQANVAVAARIIGDVSDKDLMIALGSARRMHPLLGAKVIFDDHHDAWLSTDKVPDTLLRIVPRRSETQWFEEIRHEHHMPFEPEIGPMIRLVLIYSPQVSELVVFAQHSICDGDALAILIRDILVYYANPAKEMQVLQPPTCEECFPEERISPSGFIKKIIINHYNRQWRKKPYYFTQMDFMQVHKAYWDRSQYNIALIQLEPEETSVLAAKCRENGVNITSASTAAFLAAYRDILGPFPKDRRIVWIAYDLRRHLQENIGDVFGLLAGAIQFKFDYKQNKSLWKNAQDIHNILRKDVEKLRTVGREFKLFDPTLVDALTFAPFAQSVPEAFERTKNLSAFANNTKNAAHSLSRKSASRFPGTISTNLGRLDFPEYYGDLRLDRMFFIPGASEFAPLILGGVGINGKLVFSLNYMEEVGKSNSSLAGNMIRIRNRALELLGFPEKANDRAM
ncbi:Alcohol acetyltransferase [uncultured archaeon]|nr:Alcohol acetyltransferase [uncultured archaeon]